MFELDEQLSSDCALVGELPLCRVLLCNDSQYPWLILVPKRAGVREIFELSVGDQRQLLTESSAVAEKLQQHFNADKLNVAALGNMVPQLHLHHIVRFKNDAAWPAPVWGKFAAVPYTEQQQTARLAQLRELFVELGLH